jgi:hypothetical protein
MEEFDIHQFRLKDRKPKGAWGSNKYRACRVFCMSRGDDFYFFRFFPVAATIIGLARTCANEKRI